MQLSFKFSMQNGKETPEKNLNTSVYQPTRRDTLAHSERLAGASVKLEIFEMARDFGVFDTNLGFCQKF